MLSMYVSKSEIFKPYITINMAESLGWRLMGLTVGLESDDKL